MLKTTQSTLTATYYTDTMMVASKIETFNSVQSSLNRMTISTKFNHCSNTLSDRSKNSSSTELVKEVMNVPNWKYSGEDTINLRNTFETNLSAQDIFDKLEKILNKIRYCDVIIDREKAQIRGKKWNEETYDITSFHIYFYQYNSLIRVKMLRNHGCSFTFQTLLSNIFRNIANFATEMNPIFRKPSNTFHSLFIPTDLNSSLFDFQDLNTQWTEQDINDIINELDYGYHQSIHASCKQLAKESSSNDDFLQKLCLIPKVTERFIHIVSKSQDVFVVRNMLTVLCNMWNYSRIQSNQLYTDFLQDLQTKWSDCQMIQLGTIQWNLDKSPEVLRVIEESRNILCSA